MAGIINFSDVEALIASVTIEQEALVRDNEAHGLAITINNEKLLFLRAKVAAYHDVMGIKGDADDITSELVSGTAHAVNLSQNNPKRRVYTNRRMRLGAKKRVVYELISMGIASFNSINEAISQANIDIEHSYVRDILRTSKEDGDFSDKDDGTLVLTLEGREILDNAPKPIDWSQYEAGLRVALAPADEDMLDGL